MSDRIFLSPPHMGDEELGLIEEAFRSNFIAPCGPMLDRFEDDFKALTGFKYCCGVSSGTAAMHLALHHLGVGPGDEVWASSLTFIGSVSPVVHLGGTLVFIDAELASWNLDPELLEAALEQATVLPKAIIPTDLYGQSCNLPEIVRIADQYGIPVICDSAEALGASLNGQSVGKGARAAVFSFNGNKILTTSGGGMLASDDEELIRHARFLSQQAREPVVHFEHREIGYNFRMSNIVAAIGVGQLRVLSQRVQRKREIRAFYREALGELPGVSFMPEASWGESNAWLTVLTIDEQAFGASPEEVRLALEAENIESRPVWKPMHIQPLFVGCRMIGGAVSEQLFAQGLCLPSGTSLTSSCLERITTCVASCASH